MAKYKYTAKTASGELIKGHILADDKSKLYSIIKESNQFLIDCKEVIEKESAMTSISGGKIKLKEVALFCRQMSAMLVAGVPLVKSIDIMYRQSDSKKMKLTLQKIYESVQKGNLLSESLRKQGDAFPEIMVNLIESGEASGTLDTVIQKLATQFEAEMKLNNKVSASLMYPAILAVLGTAVVILLVTVVLPQFMTMFESEGIETLPLPTRMLLFVSSSITNYWYIILIVIGIIALTIRMYLKTEDGRLNFDTLILKLPIIKPVVVKTITVRFCRTFSTLFSSGMPMLQCLNIVGKVVNNMSIKNSMESMSDDIRKGISLSQAIQKVPDFPPMVQSMISIGEESGSLDQMLENSAAYFADELETDLNKMVSLVEPIMIVIMGVIVAFVILSILLPMLQVYQNVS